MVEYLFDAIRATAGNDITIEAIITDENGVEVASGCHLMLFNDEEMLLTAPGEFTDAAIWHFTIPSAETEGLHGRYWYCICGSRGNLCFKNPIYLI